MDPELIKKASKVQPDSDYCKELRLKNRTAKIRGYAELAKLLDNDVKEVNNDGLSSIVNNRNK